MLRSDGSLKSTRGPAWLAACSTAARKLSRRVGSTLSARATWRSMDTEDAAAPMHTACWYGMLAPYCSAWSGLIWPAAARLLT
jgi:hypothetical protein